MSKLPRARALRVGAARRDVAPRRIPRLVRWHLSLRGVDTQLSWLLAVLGMLACIVVIPRVRLDAARLTEAAAARVTDNDGAVVDYEYFDRDGKLHQGHERGHPGSGLSWQPGSSLSIRYDPNDPAVSTLVDTKAMVGPGSLALLAFPGGAIILALVFMWLRRRRILRLLRYGNLARGHLVHGTLPLLEFDYEVEGEPRTIEIAAPPLWHRLVDDRDVPLLYDPSNPDHAIALDELPGRPRIDGDRLVTTEATGAGPLVLPAAVVVEAIALVVLWLR